jgi:TolA-binding protein
MRFASLLLLFWISVSLAGCLQTRDTQKEHEEKQVLQKQLSTLQTTSADSHVRFQDLDEENRRLAGRVEALEMKLAQFSSKNEKSSGAVEAKLKENNEIYKEEFAKIGVELTQIKEQILALQNEGRRAAESAISAKGSEGTKDGFKAGEGKFEKKNWKEAILDYERYRAQHPKGKQFSAATYKIGVCFQELGLSEEAKAFYEEVIAKFPKTKDAEKATTRLKALNKKK